MALQRVRDHFEAEASALDSDGRSAFDWAVPG